MVEEVYYSANKIRESGKHFVGMTIIDVRRRSYEPKIGRWLSVDPKGFSNMFSFISLYNYVFNSPLNYFDKSGQDIDGHSTPHCCAVDKSSLTALGRVANPTNTALAAAIQRPVITQSNRFQTMSYQLIARSTNCLFVESFLWLQIGAIFAATPECNTFAVPNDPRNMPHQHCLWNCHMTIVKGEKFAEECSQKKEDQDVKVCMLINSMPANCWTQLSNAILELLAGSCCSAYQLSDFIDNETGQRCGCVLPTYLGCAACCTAGGVGPNTPEGSGTRRPYGPYCFKGAEDLLKQLKAGGGR